MDSPREDWDVFYNDLLTPDKLDEDFFQLEVEPDSTMSAPSNAVASMATVETWATDAGPSTILGFNDLNQTDPEMLDLLVRASQNHDTEPAGQEVENMLVHMQTLRDTYAFYRFMAQLTN